MLGIKVGDRYHIEDGVRAKIALADEHKIIMENEDDLAAATIFKPDEFRNKVSQNEITPIEDLTFRVPLTDYQKRERDVRKKYIHTLSTLVHDLGIRPTSPSTYTMLIAEVEKRFPETQARNPTTGHKDHPARSTLARHWHTWITSGLDDDALAPKKRTCTKRISYKSEEVLTNYLSNTWNHGKSDHRGSHYENYKDEVISFRDPDMQIVSERTFRRRLSELRVFEKQYINATHAQRNQLNLEYTKKYPQRHILERVELDRATFNLCLIDDETGLATETVSLLAAIDCYSRYPLSVVLEVGQAENKENVSNLIRHIFLKDDKLTAAGKPQRLVIDNGSGFRNKIVQSLAENLNVELISAPSNRPTAKPFVETFFNTLRTRFFKGWRCMDQDQKRYVGIPGYRPKRMENNASVNLKKEARLTVSQFKEQLHLFLQAYCNNPHKRTKVTPAQAWALSKRATPMREVQYHDVTPAFHVFSKQESNQLQSRGFVTLYAQQYASSELKHLYHELHRLGDRGENPSVTIRFCPFDARYITVTAQLPNSTECKTMVVPNRDLDLMDGPISFEELAGERPKSEGIYDDRWPKSNGSFKGLITKLHKPKQIRSTPRSGKPASKFEDNNQKNLTAWERVERSNRSEQTDRQAVEANIDAFKLEPPTQEHLPVNEALSTHNSTLHNTEQDDEDLW